MSEALLNENQRRRISSNLHLLEEDMTALRRLPELDRAGAPYDRIRALIQKILETTEILRRALALGVPMMPSLGRRVAAVGEIWAVRMEDLLARRLTGYGAVHPGLAQELDPYVTSLASLSQRLADAASRLPET